MKHSFTRQALAIGILIGAVAALFFTVPVARAAGQHVAVELPRLLSGAPATERRLSVAEVQTARGAPIRQGKKEVVTSASVSTTGTEIFTDLAATERRIDFVQNIRITNRASSGTICIYDKPFATACSSSPPTCDGTATDTGAPVLASQTLTEAWDGDTRLCWRASGASIIGTAERVARFSDGAQTAAEVVE